MWIVAKSDNKRERIEPKRDEVAGPQKTGGASRDVEPSNANRIDLWHESRRISGESRKREAKPGKAGWWPMSVIAGVDDGVADRMERTVATGQGQVPAVVRMAWEALSK